MYYNSNSIWYYLRLCQACFAKLVVSSLFRKFSFSHSVNSHKTNWSEHRNRCSRRAVGQASARQAVIHGFRCPNYWFLIFRIQSIVQTGRFVFSQSGCLPVRRLIPKDVPCSCSVWFPSRIRPRGGDGHIPALMRCFHPETHRWVLSGV